MVDQTAANRRQNNSSSRSSGKRTRTCRVNLRKPNYEWINQQLPGVTDAVDGKIVLDGGGYSWVINQALEHFRVSVVGSLGVAKVRFNPEEMEVMLEEFKRFPNAHFTNMNHFIIVLEQADEARLEHCRHWNKAVHILKNHCSLDEINAIGFKARLRQ